MKINIMGIQHKFQNVCQKIMINISLKEKEISQAESYVFRGFLYSTAAIGLLLVTMNCAEAITTESLRAPIQELKKEVFDWLFVAKIASIAVGAIVGIAKQSVIGFGTGFGIASGIHFGDMWLGDGSAAVI